MRKCLLGLLFILALTFGSCEDEHYMPAYTQDLAEMTTNVHGMAKMLIFDDGRKMKIVNQLGGLTPDSLYRIRALYVPTEDGVELRGAQLVVAPLTLRMDPLLVKTEPVELKAIWGSPRYVNMLLGVKSGGGSQMIGFIENGIVEMADGIKKLSITLFHDQIDDPLYYTQDVYASCPIYPYAYDLVSGRDSVEMIIHTFKGITRKSFLY